MLSKCLFINPYPSPGPQSLVISGDTEALTALRDKLSELLEGDGATSATNLTEIESLREIEYRFILFPEEMLRAMKAEEN